METSAPAQHGQDLYSRIAAPLHTFVLLAVQASLAVRGILRVDQVHAMASVGRVGIYERTILSEWLVFALMVLGVWLHGSSVFTVIGDRWRSVLSVLKDIGIAAAFWIGSTAVLSMIGAHAHSGAPNPAVQFLLPQGRFEMWLWIGLSITAGICEEAIFRGYYQRQFIALTKSAPMGIVLSAIAFGAAHSYQGIGGAIRIGLQGLLLGMLANWRRSVRPGMIAHAWGDIFAGALARLMKIPVG